MTIKIGSNIASIQAQRRLGEATSSLGKIYERLSSGQRINTASDDAAGLAIANDLNAKNRVYTQAIRNVSDGISHLNIGEGALHALEDITIRQKELAEQAANGTFSATQRRAITTEAKALVQEYNRIIETTKFNGQRVLDVQQSNGVLRIQAGFGVAEGLSLSVGSSLARSVGAATFQTGVAYSDGNVNGFSDASIQAVDLNRDGILDLVSANGGDSRVSILIGNADGTFQTRVSYAVGGSPFSLQTGYIDGDSFLDLVTANESGSTSILLGNGDGTFGTATAISTPSNPRNVQLGDVNGDGKLDIVSSNYGGGSLNVILGNGNGTFQAVVTYAVGNQPNSVTIGDFNGDGKLDLASADYLDNTMSILIGNGNGTFASRNIIATGGAPWTIKSGDLNGDGRVDLVTADYSGTLSVFIGNGDGSFKSRISLAATPSVASVQIADFNGDGKFDLINAGGGNGDLWLGNGDGTFSAKTTISFGAYVHAAVVADINRDGVNDLVGATGGNGISVIIQNTVQATTIADYSMYTRAEALAMLPVLDTQLSRITAELGNIGAMQSRLAVAASNLQSTTLNYKAAASRITDADIALEAANLTSTQIRQQAAASVLSQANQAPALALSLLR